ncbi:hypothetical protein C0993_002300 [Termitomyces sp. T159_Od127]|nr:hypothetical protein C0993_002300 [Termitomyces sp. T159_Od127]
MPPPRSAMRLSSDTTHSLPVYAAHDDDDRPPDYPDSAEEADRDTDSSHSVPAPSPRRRQAHRRRQSGKTPHLSSTDPCLDSLLARSVHALEMSNTLLQSSMSAQTALAPVFADPPADERLQSSVRGLASRARPRWADDLAEISRGVDGLFGEPGAVSCSLPTSSSRPHRADLVAHAPLSPAYTMLSSFVGPRHSPSAPASASSTPAARTPPLPAFFSRRSPPTCKTHEHEHEHGSPGVHAALPPHRRMTPPAEESSSSSSSSSSTSCLAKRTVRSLRKILDEQPPAPAPAQTRLRAPAFLPRSPPPAAQAGTSTATASISRLYTRAKHTSSTRPPSPPRQSAMKHAQPSASEARAAAGGEADANANAKGNANEKGKFRLPALLGVRSWSTASTGSLAAGGSSAASSGRSTPRRISFAALPESYRGEGSARFGRRARERERKRGRGRGRDEEGEGEGEEGGWWSTWFLGGGGGGGGGGGREERIEERFGRSWGGRVPGASAGFGPGADEWAV